MGKKKKKVDANGSFLVKTGGAINFIGAKSDDANQIVTFNEETSELQSTDASLLFDEIYCVSQYEDSAPDKRPNGDELLQGDLWTSSIDKNFYVWSEEEELWIPASTPTGTVIQSVSPTPPSGYLLCNGLECPPQFALLRSLLAPDFLLPNIPVTVGPIYSYIKF
jgi:hypothetical protein